MNSDDFSHLVESLEVGKQTHQSTYVHRSALSGHALLKFIELILKALKQNEFDWQIAKFSRRCFQFSVLSYPQFENDAYPALKASVSVDLVKKKHQVTDYSETDNPPILHRKELMVTSTHPLYQHFTDITSEGELAGLYEQGAAIGFKLGWEAVIQKSGYELLDGRLFRRSMMQSETQIDRHKTAINRFSLSAPMKVLERRGYLDGQRSVFDYGCGRGDDLRELQLNGIDANGWDPNFCPDEELVASDIVSLGFVLNVIEDVSERVEALELAYSLANSFLIVSCMLSSESVISKMTPYKDGVITSRNTFQKYYTQVELKTFVQDVLEREAITAGPGIVIIFKDQLEEQRFLLKKIRTTTRLKSHSRPLKSSQQIDLLLEQHHELTQGFWERCLVLGREPLKNEIRDLDDIVKYFGSSKKLFNALVKRDSDALFSIAEQMRRNDYLVYFALQKFEKRKPYNSMPEEQKHDIKKFFGNYSSAVNEGLELLYSIAEPEKLLDAAENAQTEIQSAALCDQSCLILPTSKVGDLPPVLRVYVGAAGTLFGECEEADLVKIHLGSGKVTFLTYDDFSSPIPFLKERVKVKLAEQDIDYFDYVNENRRPPLLFKSQFMESEEANYKKQRGLDSRLEGLGLVHQNSENIVNRGEYFAFLTRNHLQIKGYRLYSS